MMLKPYATKSSEESKSDMDCSFRTTFASLAVAGTLSCLCTSMAVAQEELPKRAVWKPWQRDISQFDADLRKVVGEAQIPEEESLKKRIEEKSGGLEVITDGYGGVVDFDAAQGTVQYLANDRFASMNIEWEFALANDTKIYWNKSTKLIPKITHAAKDRNQDSEQPLFAIRITKTDAGPFQAGDRVRLKASIDDFSRFRKDYTRATGLVAIYYLEDAPNPVFSLRLDEAEVTLIKGANQDAGKSEAAKPEGTSKEGAGDSGRNELDQLLEEAEKERLAYSPDKKLLAHLGRRLVAVWSVGERRQLHRFVLEGRPLTAAFSPDGGSLVTADGEGNLEYRSTIKLWSLATGESRLIAQFLGSPTHFSFSPDGSRLAATSILGIIGSITRNPEDGNAGERIQTGGSIHVWRVSDGRELLKVDIELPEYSAKLMQFRRAGADDPDFSRDKAAGDALVAAYEEAVRKRVPNRLKFSPDSKRLIAVSGSGQETIIDLRTGKKKLPLHPTSRGEQDIVGQPATRSKSNLESADKPQPESEGRSW